MSDQNLTGALKASLDILDGESPLTEATPDAVDELLERINSAMVEGLPGRISDEELEQAANVYRAMAYKWTQEEQQPKARSGGRRKPPAEAVDIDL